jgi:outer membrane protein, multidrug efflux system
MWSLKAKAHWPAIRRGCCCMMLGVVSALTACSVGPNYKRPDIPPPAAWSGAAQTNVAAQHPDQAAALWPSADWWRAFNSTELDELISEARSANDDIAAAIARVDEADAQAQVAGAALLPSVSAGANGNRARGRSSIAEAGGSTGTAGTVNAITNPPTYDLFTTTLTASYEIDFWGKYRALHDAARMAAAASRYDRGTIELTVMTTVANTYFQVLEIRDRLHVAQDNLASAEATLSDLRAEEQVGTATALEVAQQATTVAGLQAVLPPLQEQLQQTTDALAILVGKEPEALNVPAATLAELGAPRVSPGLPSELLARRPDIASAEAQLKEANANIRAARAAFFPTIDLTAEGGLASTALGTLLNPTHRIFAVSAGLTQPIFQGGALTGQYRFTKARYTELLANYHKAVISAFGNVEDALAAVRQSAEQLQREQQEVDTARDAYELSQAELAGGTVNILTVLNTETALFSAQDALVQAKYSHLNALVTLFNALGGGWQQS